MTAQQLGKHHMMIVHKTYPFNAEPPKELLCSSYITPVELFYVRNHGNIPTIDANKYRLVVQGLVEKQLVLSLDDIKNLPRYSVCAMLQCAGNRRRELIKVRPLPGEIPWQEQALGNAEWTGCRLKDVLLLAGVKATAEHVAFTGADECIVEGMKPFGFGGSIPLSKAMRDEVLLAYEMNGKPLEPVHGFPLRSIVPGYIAARSVKWLTHITVQSEPSNNYYQRRAYKLFPTDITITDDKPQSFDWNRGFMLGGMPVNSIILSPRDNDKLKPGIVTVSGIAFSGGQLIERVEVTTDDGKTWTQSQLFKQTSAWTWRFWHATLNLIEGVYEIACRAFDENCNTQPSEVIQVWNKSGYMNNAWHRIRVIVTDKTSAL